jgi:hypothetical protein
MFIHSAVAITFDYERALAKPLGDGVNCTPHHSAVAITLDHEASVGKPLGFLHVNQCHATRFVM